MTEILELLHNISIPIAFVVISGFTRYMSRKSYQTILLQGVLFGFAIALGMLHPLRITDGLILDARTVIISIAAIYYGPYTAAISVFIGSATRVLIGGVGAWHGVTVMVFTAILGSYYYFKNKELISKPKLTLYIMALITHVMMNAILFTIPDGLGPAMVYSTGLAVMLTFPLGTLLFGIILNTFSERDSYLELLEKSRKELKRANKMLVESIDSLRKTEIELDSSLEMKDDSEESFRKIFNSSTDASLIMDGFKVVECNQAALELFEMDYRNDLCGLDIWDITPIMDDERETVLSKAKRRMDESREKANSRFEWVHRRKDGDNIYLDIIITSLNLGGRQLNLAVLRDVSRQKEIEKRLKHLSFRDQLTGLYNRRYYEKQLKLLNREENLPVTIVLGDVNRLKMVNDSFGHISGDDLLKKVAEAMSSVLRQDEVVARIGGDEFAILLPGTNKNQAERIIERIEKAVCKLNVNGIDLSISFGQATKTEPHQRIETTFRLAEDRLYKKKLFDSPGLKGRTIEAIIRTLHEKNAREEEHSRRVACICESMGQRLGLSSSEIHEIRTLGLLHDIGKIAVPEAILNKTDILDSDEWEIIKKHSETGYRILSTLPELKEISENVLSHHERWDGSGYPRGITGKAIPLHSRILAIADTFDALTNERSYRDQISKEDAIEIIRKGSGIKFDPDLVRLFIELSREGCKEMTESILELELT